MTHRQIVELIAELEPRPDVPSTMRKLPARGGDAPPAAAGGARPNPVPGDAGGGQLCARRVGRSEILPDGPRRPATVAPMSRSHAPKVEPLAPSRYRVQFTASVELHRKLERLQALMRSSVPDGDLAGIIDAAVTERLERLEAQRFARTKKPRKTLADTDTTPKSRYIPAAVRRAVEKRDGGRCTYRDPRGRRCTKRHDLEFHHRRPFGRGGEHRPENLALMCRTHNGLMAERDYGKEVMAPFRRGRSVRGVQPQRSSH